MCFVTNFGLVLCVCNVHAVIIFDFLYLVNLFSIRFCELLKILELINLIMLTKLCFVVVFQDWLRNCKWYKPNQKSNWAYEINAGRDVFGFLIAWIFLINLDQKRQAFYRRLYCQCNDFPQTNIWQTVSGSVLINWCM